MAAKCALMLALPAIHAVCAWARAAHSASTSSTSAMLLVAGSRLLTLGVIKFHNLGCVNASASVGLEPVVHHSLMVCLQSLAVLFEKLGSAWPGIHPCTRTPCLKGIEGL